MRKNLTVLLLYHSSSEVRGKMRRYFYEVKANTFVGTVSAGVRDILWQNIIESKTEASLIYHTSSEQGFEYKTTKKDNNYTFEDFDDIILPTSIDSSLKLSELYAKPDYKLLDHLLDVGYIAEGLMKYGRAYNMTKTISNITNIDFNIIVESISWLCALHDIGKAHPHFISKMYANSTNENLIEIYESLKERNLVKDGDYSGFRHERYSRDILRKYFISNNYEDEAEQFADLVAYHHQGKSENDFSDEIKLNNIEWITIHDKIFDEIEKIWTFDKKFSENQKYINGINYSILSIMITADWIASGKKWRELHSQILDKRECAKKFIEENELYYKPIQERFSSISWHSAFDFEQNNMQKTVIAASKEKPDVMIVEYPCGGGKTEAALAAAINMGYDKSGIFIATPTMATAKGMTKRMQEIASKVNLGLNIPEFDSSILWSEDDMSKIPSELWVSKSRHRMLYPFAVGTVDQILKTMLYFRYAAIGLLGLSDKVLVIDEVHAYDSYMKTEIKVLLKWAKFLQIPVILLSATLPTLTKVQLLKAVGYKGKDIENSNVYPLVTTIKDGQINCYPIEATGRTFKVNIIETSDYQNAWNEELSKHYNGCTAFIGSTVDKTWDLYKLAEIQQLNPVMFNGRSTLASKERKTEKLLKELGKNRENRPKNQTLVATAIIEQSLDIDLDRMFTCIAPIDLLIQRFGRVWRHSDIGTIRENEIVKNPINIIISNSMNDMSSSKIYGVPLLEKTIAVLKGINEINTVTDARKLIDTVYDDIEIIEKPQLIINAAFKSIEDPSKDAMFDNDNNKYNKFKPIESNTRYETIPSINIAIVEPLEIENIEENYKVLSNIMRNNVVGISYWKHQDIKINPIKFKHKLLKDVNFYFKQDLEKQNIRLTEDGLKWHNNP